jgi:uncharacterized membrane protein
MMINSIDEYLRQLKKELTPCDRATIQDALSDAEEYLRNALENRRENQPEVSEESVFQSIMEEYGTPSEIAEAYKKIEARSSLSPITKTQREQSSFLKRFFGVVVDPTAWGALFYLLFSLLMGIIYFTWTVTGISLSLGLLILVIGIPIAGLFILSTRGLALLEGRMVEALLGIRMPHRPLFSSKTVGLWGKFKSLISDKYTWFSMGYMILQLPLGIAYFSVFVTLFAVSLYSILTPVLELGFGMPLFTNWDAQYYLNGWVMPFIVVGGILLFVGTMHLAKVIGNMHGKLAKAMLVRE